MNDIRWVNQGHPQTLMIGTVLLYIDAFFDLVGGAGLGSLLGFAVLCITIASGVGIANNRRAWWLAGVAVSALALLAPALSLFDGGTLRTIANPDSLLALVFPVAQVAALVHPMSRNYVKVMFE